MAGLTRHLMIQGRVQGIGFRWSLASKAKALGLRGWVRNRRDGSVEALVCGPAVAVEELTAWAYEGPPMARVERIITNDDSGNTDPASGFEQRTTF